jgi:hypothetical protein
MATNATEEQVAQGLLNCILALLQPDNPKGAGSTKRIAAAVKAYTEFVWGPDDQTRRVALATVSMATNATEEQVAQGLSETTLFETRIP